MILCRNPARIRRFVLNAPLSSAIWPLTIRCRLGDYTRAMMIKRILTILATVAAGTAGTSLALAQVYPQAPGIHLFPRPQLPARRLSGRLSRRARSSAGFRRAGRRPGSARPGFRGAVAARPHSVAGRSALRPPGRRASGLYRSRRAAGTDHVSERSALRPSRWAGGDLCRPSSGAPPQQPIRIAATTARCGRPRRSARPAPSPVRFAASAWAPTAGRWCCPRCRPTSSPKRVRRNCRRTCAARKSISSPRSRRERWSSIRRTRISITCSAAGVRSATASASAVTVSPGPACRKSAARPSGRIGIRRAR